MGRVAPPEQAPLAVAAGRLVWPDSRAQRRCGRRRRGRGLRRRWPRQRWQRWQQWQQWLFGRRDGWSWWRGRRWARRRHRRSGRQRRGLERQHRRGRRWRLRDAEPSAGCGKAGRPSGGKVTVTNDHIYDFPTSYDGNKPFPLLIGFHAAGNPIDQIEGMTNNTDFATNYVRAFPKSAGNEWVYNTDISNKAYKVYDDLMANYCIDANRVFATGHSSGAQMIVQILTHSDAAKHMGFKAVAPVAASDYGAITVPIPVMYIQGKMDNVRGNDGASTVARFRTANMCMTTSMPYSQVAGCQSSGTTVTPGCIRYDGCTVPTIWCSHNDPQYSDTNHGVPCFAIKAMYDFFATIP